MLITSPSRVPILAFDHKMNPLKGNINQAIALLFSLAQKTFRLRRQNLEFCAPMLITTAAQGRTVILLQMHVTRDEFTKRESLLPYLIPNPDDDLKPLRVDKWSWDFSVPEERVEYLRHLMRILTSVASL